MVTTIKIKKSKKLGLEVYLVQVMDGRELLEERCFMSEQMAKQCMNKIQRDADDALLGRLAEPMLITTPEKYITPPSDDYEVYPENEIVVTPEDKRNATLKY